MVAARRTDKAYVLARALAGGSPSSYPSPGFLRAAKRILDNPQKHVDDLVAANGLRHLGTSQVEDTWVFAKEEDGSKDGDWVRAYVVMPVHKHDWRYGWGLVVCANRPCPDYGEPGKKPWPRTPGWNSSDPKTWAKYHGRDPEREYNEEEDEEEDDDD